MKIEISEVFITRADSITMDAAPSAIGIAALEPAPKTVGWRQRVLAVLQNTFGTPNAPQNTPKLPKCRPSVGTASYRVVPGSIGLKKVICFWTISKQTKATTDAGSVFNLCSIRGQKTLNGTH